MLIGTDIGGTFTDIVFLSTGQKTIEFLRLLGNRCLGVEILLRLTQKVRL
jgi:N-methylhydantoinase A/oxoprolinase/acetone carboxylase beta subunit